jgi:putative DNA primase/helicase
MMTTNKPAEEILKRLDGVRSTKDGWMALCPAHLDKNPSLSVRLQDERVLLHCFAGCTSKDVFAAIGIDPSTAFQSRSTRSLVAEYDYRDESGDLLFQVLRFEPKSFSQRRPDGRGGWDWQLNGVRRVLYGLPELLQAEAVLIVEGEKDCDLARKMGFVSTCNPGGAGKWRDDYSECLRGKTVWIVEDADDPGRKHGQQVVSSLYGKAKAVKLIELEGAKDLSEFVERGGSREQIDELFRKAPNWKPLSPNRGFSLTSLGDLLAEPEEKVSWLLADKLPAGGISLVSAKPKVGKSTFARCLALAVALGEPFLGCPTAQGPVIYLALEEKRSEVKKHFSDLGATGEEPIHIHCAAAPAGAMAELCRIAQEVKPVLVIVDPLFKFLRVRDENAYAEVSNAIEPLLSLARETGAHVMLLHHNGKAERSDAMDAILGSTAIFGGVDTAIIIKRSDRFRTLQSSQKYGVDWPETTLVLEETSRSLSLGVERAQADTSRIVEQILDYLRGSDESHTRVDIETHVEGKTAHKRAALKSLTGTGQVTFTGTGSKGDPFLYRIGTA